MAQDPNKRPIVIKKIKKVVGGHHGGAWKVAYADFVTAMMAFFLLLWLLSTAPKETLQGIAEHFTPTIGIKDSMGIGFKGGDAASEVGISKAATMTPQVITGKTPQGMSPDNIDMKSPEESEAEENMFKQGENALRQAMQQDKEMSKYVDNVNIQQTPEGLRIDLMDSDKYAMFNPGSAQLTEHGMTLLSRMSVIIKRMPNYISITGHTDASPVETDREGYSGWELSSDRANAARRFLVRGGIEAERPKRVVGMADRDLMVPKEPRSPRNRRIAILLMKGSHILIPEGMELPPQVKAAAEAAAATAPDATPAAVSVPESSAPADQAKPQDEAAPAPEAAAAPEEKTGGH
jgi:chemotaxis protein MotB